MEKSHSHKTAAVLEILTGAGLILFWIGFFTIGLAPEHPPEGYFAFEHSFPLPDTCLAGVLLSAGFFLLRKDPRGRVLSLAGSGALVFLGLLDFSFNIRKGMYVLSLADGVLNGFINLWCVGLGLGLFIVFGRRGA